MRGAFLRSEFVASAVVARMRDGDLPSASVACGFDAMPFIGTLRAVVEPNDVPWLLRLSKTDADPLAGLAISVVRQHMSPTVIEAFERRWSRATPYVRNRLMWRLLDQPQLDDRWHDRFSEFVFGNWDMFIDFNRRFFGKDDGLSTLIQRLGDKSFPDSKRWVYFCCAPAATDSATARALLELGLQSADARTRQVCTRLLRDGWSETAHDDDSHGQLSNAEGASYVAEAVVAVLRRGQRPEHSDSDSLNRLPIVDLIRRLIGDEDLIWVLAAAGTSEGATRGFFTSLLRNHATRQDVQATLREWWAEADAFTRAHLMWRILDDPALPQQWHKQLFEFVFENWAIFNEVSLKFVGDSSTVVTEALKRLQDRSVPTSKQWAYLCRVPGASNDADAARALVTIGQQSADDFTRTVADRLLSKFYAGRVSSVHQVQ